MHGRDVLWQPGTDHAGIATQMVVERQLAEEGIELDRGLPLAPGNTRSIGRQEFIERVWAWREQSGGIILKQLRRLGASCDWKRERFTMDAGLSEAVLKVRSEEHTSELQSLMRISYAVFCLKKKTQRNITRDKHKLR